MTILSALLCVAAFSSSVALDVGTFRLPAASPTFDPMHPATRQLLMRELNVGAVNVEVLAANGGLNGGVWILSDPQRAWGDMVLKLRPVEPELYYPGEAKHLASLASMHPALARDPDVVFPSRILACLDAYGSKQGDLILMRKAPGHTLSRFIFDKIYAGQGEELMAVFESVGRQLRAFHSRYGKQHTDFHSANVMVDAGDRNRVTFIDLGGMGLPIMDDDVQHLIKDMRLQSTSYHPDTSLERGILRFERGYNTAPAGHPQTLGLPGATNAAPRVPAAAPRSPAAATATFREKPKLHSSASESRPDSTGETAGFELLWAAIMGLEETLEWEHLLVGAMVVVGTPAVLRTLHRNRFMSGDAPCL